MNSEVVYSDKLVEITDNSILFRWYYFPFSSKRVRFSDVDYIVTKKPTFWNGKWRIHGTGDFKTWLPCDWKRPIRDRIFIISFQNKWKRIGFTVEDSETVAKIFQDTGLLQEGKLSKFGC